MRPRNSLPIEIDADGKPPLGMAPAAFLRDYWQKRPLLIRNAFPDFVSPLQPEDLAGLACEEAARSRIVSCDRRRDHYSLRDGPFKESEFPHLPRQDWTLLVQDVDKWDADVAALLPQFDFLPQWRIAGIQASFAAPGGCEGPRVDPQDAFLLQAQGRQHCRIDAGPGAPSAFRGDVELDVRMRFEPSHDWLLGPGDLLYLPPGVPHQAVAKDASLTLRLGMHAPTQVELLLDLAEQVASALPAEGRYADPDLTPVRDPHRIDDAALARVRASVAALFDCNDERLRVWFGGFVTRYRMVAGPVAPVKPLDPDGLGRALADGSVLHRHPYARLAWSGSGRGCLLFAAGEALPCPARDAARLCQVHSIDVAGFDALGTRGRAVVHHLYARGSLVLQRKRRSKR